MTPLDHLLFDARAALNKVAAYTNRGARHVAFTSRMDHPTLSTALVMAFLPLIRWVSSVSLLYGGVLLAALTEEDAILP